MTATMALKFAASAMDIRRSAEIIMDTLPICSVRKISYSTFTVVDMASTGRDTHHRARQSAVPADSSGWRGRIAKTEVRPERWQDRVISFSSFDVQREDRIVFFSDGITQAGMGEYPHAVRMGAARAWRHNSRDRSNGTAYFGAGTVACCWWRGPKRWMG